MWTDCGRRLAGAELGRIVRVRIMAAPRDTLDEAWSRHLEALRAIPPEERVRLALEMSGQVRQIALAGLRSRHPEWTPAQIQESLEELMLGSDLARTARQARIAPAR
jgi:hypothetical protein